MQGNSVVEQHTVIARRLFWNSGVHTASTILLALEIKRGINGVTEVGMAWTNSQEVFSHNNQIKARCMVVEETGDNFDVGQIQKVMVSDLQGHVTAQCSDISCSATEIVFVGHSVHHQLNWLRENRITFDNVCDTGLALQGVRDFRAASIADVPLIIY